MFSWIQICLIFLFASASYGQQSKVLVETSSSRVSEFQRALIEAGDEMLESLDISYVYGGGVVGDEKTCQLCNQCLEGENPKPKERLVKCPLCKNCSLDCSHFTHMVFERAGLRHPYLTTSQMLELSAPELERKYGLIPVSTSGSNAIPGDLLVYKGHVVLVEKTYDLGRADIIHATGGKDLKGPGQGIQRERMVRMDSFRGELRRVLRHKKVETIRRSAGRGGPGPSIDRSRLRPVEK